MELHAISQKLLAEISTRDWAFIVTSMSIQNHKLSTYTTLRTTPTTTPSTLAFLT